MSAPRSHHLPFPQKACSVNLFYTAALAFWILRTG